MSSSVLVRPSAQAIVPWLVSGVCVVLLAVNLLHDRLFHTQAPEAAAVAGEAKGEQAAASRLTTVSLTEGKWKAAQIATEPARTIELPTEVGVPGRIEANAERRIDIRPRASGVISEVHVSIGQHVKAGDPLFTLDSPEVGKERLNLRSKQRELATARFDADWQSEIAANVDRIVPELRKGIEASVLEKEYASRALGNFRAQLLTAYAEFDIASHEEQKSAGLYKDKIIGEHQPFLAKHTREGAQARFEAALEQVARDAKRQKRIADQTVRDAEAAVIEVAQRLHLLGVDEDIPRLLARTSGPEKSLASDDRARFDDLTRYQIVAPMQGSIIEKTSLAVPSQKVDMTDTLLTLANLANVWVTANFPESDFAALSALRSGTIRFTATAYPGRSFEAKLRTVGSAVDQTTRAVPLWAETDNTDRLLKLGMFVSIVVDARATENVLTVPTAAVVELDGRDGVFIPSGTDGRTFSFRPLKLGRASAGRRVVVSGLSKGETVVATGAFVLKSELILQNQEEEE
jgi:multidrug efflux pump subunit AcrA (membrane-fusion protein)